MQEEPAVGNRENKSLGGDFKTNLRNSLGVSMILGYLSAMFTRGVGTEGHRHNGIVSLAVMFLPALIDGARTDRLGHPAADGTGAALTGLLVAIWCVRKLASAGNRGVTHSNEVGRSLLSSRLHPFWELILGLGVAWAVAQFSDAMGGLMAISAAGNAIAMKAILERQRMEAVVAFDQMKKGEIVGDTMGRYER